MGQCVNAQTDLNSDYVHSIEWYFEYLNIFLRQLIT
jgi:hypothetical protein